MQVKWANPSTLSGLTRCNLVILALLRTAFSMIYYLVGHMPF